MKTRHALALGAGVLAALALTACADDSLARKSGNYAQAAPAPGAQADMVAGSTTYLPVQLKTVATEETEKYPDAPLNTIKSVATDPVSNFSIDVDTAAYANVRRYLTDGTLPPRDAVRVEEMVNYFDYHYAKPTSEKTPFRATTVLVPSPWSKDRQTLHIGLQGYDMPRTTQPPLNLVFLIDTSGSMQSEDRLPLVKKTLDLLIAQLGAKDHVSIVAYAGSAGEVLAPTSGKDKQKIRSALDVLSAGGSTAGGEGLALAYSLGQQNFDAKAVNRVILLTDGDFNVGVDDPAKLKDFIAEKRKTGIYLSVYGYGRGNYNDAMMQTIAQTGNGTAAYIDTMQEARKLLRDDLSGSLFPIADDVKIQIEFNPATVSEYRLIGYETRMLNREDFNNDKVDAGEVGSGVSVTALYEITPRGAKGSSDPLRYQQTTEQKKMGDELAFLKIRYKAPGGEVSKLISQPVSSVALASVDAAPEATRWALAVAGFSERLRGSPHVSDAFGYDAITKLAQGARGSDEYGLRAEFVQLTRAAKDAKSLNE
ncbi:MAG: vWA domain-containing protein [Parvibaculaceae bacterium]